MPRSLMTVLMLTMAGGFVAWAWRTAAKVTAGRDDAARRGPALVSAAGIMVLILLVNATAFMGFVEQGWAMQREMMGDWATAEGIPDAWDLVYDQLALLVGAAGLMALTVAAIRDERSLTCDVELAGPTVLLTMVEKMLPHFWLAALGLGVIFGVFAPAVALLLAIELTISYALGKLLITAKRKATG